MTAYGTMLIPVPLEQAGPALRKICAAGYAVPAAPGFCLLHPDRFVDGNDAFALAGPISAGLGAPVPAAFQYDGGRPELEVWRDGVRVHHYDSRPPRDDKAADRAAVGADPAAFLNSTTGPVDSHRPASALADTAIDAEDMDVDGEPGYVWAQALHWDVPRALGHPDQVVRRAQWDHRHIGRRAADVRRVAGQHRTRSPGTAELPL